MTNSLALLISLAVNAIKFFFAIRCMISVVMGAHCELQEFISCRNFKSRTDHEQSEQISNLGDPKRPAITIETLSSQCRMTRDPLQLLSFFLFKIPSKFIRFIRTSNRRTFDYRPNFWLLPYLLIY